MTTFENDIAYYTARALVVLVGTLAMMSSCMKIQSQVKTIVILLASYLLWVCFYTFTVMKLFGLAVTLRLCVPALSVPAMLTFILYLTFRRGRLYSIIPCSLAYQ